MRKELNRETMHQAIDSTLSGLNGDPSLFQRVITRAEEGEIKVKKKLSAGLVLAIVLILLAVAAVAVGLLTHQEVMEQVAVPLAVENDADTGVNESYTAEELAELVRRLNENGITLEENNRIMQAMQTGQGYYEEETIMEICRQAFGGNYYTWTLEQQDWFESLMVKIGFHESHMTRMPGKDNMTYEEAEAFAFQSVRSQYGQELPLEDRTVWQLERQFYEEEPDSSPSGRTTAIWSFSLLPRDLEHARYTVYFEDQDPAGTVEVNALLRDWTKYYTGEDLLYALYDIYGWNLGQWPQEAWQQLHEKLQKAELDPLSRNYQALRAYRMTDYPTPDETDISRVNAIQHARDAVNDSRAALDGAVLATYEGERVWVVSLLVPDDQTASSDNILNVVYINSTDGVVKGTRKQTLDDSESMAFVPEKAYKVSWEGLLRRSDVIRLAAEAIEKEYPGLDLLKENAYETIMMGVRFWQVTFQSKDIHHGDASARVSMEGEVSEIEADTEPLTGDNLFTRYWHAYGYYGQWDQSVWVSLEKDMAALNPMEIDGKLLKMSHYPEESAVTIQHEQAQALGIKATGKRVAEVNTCVLADAAPHPVWIIRILTEDPDNPIIGIDAETGEVAFTELFKVDYTPHYTLYSLPQTWRKMELETFGAPYLAKIAITHQFGDMWLDEPELDVDNEENWTLEQDGLTVRYIGRWAGMKAYEVELDENGFVLRCEESDSPSTDARPVDPNQTSAEGNSGMTSNIQHDPETGEAIPTPTPQPGGRLWFWGKVIDDKGFWHQFEEAMTAYGVTADNYPEKEKEWFAEYGPMRYWPQECFVMAHFMTATEEADLETNPLFFPEGKPGLEEMREKARAAFHEAFDAEMGAEWVDDLMVDGNLYNKCFLFTQDRWSDQPAWWFNMIEYENENDWNGKGYVVLDLAGNILETRLDLMGNG